MPGWASRWRQLALIALLVRVLVPAGFMPAPAGGFALIPCSGHAQAATAMASAHAGAMAMDHHGAPPHQHSDLPPSDHPCSFSGAHAPLDPPQATVFKPQTTNWPALAVYPPPAFRPVQPLPAPPPPSTGPPALA